MRTKETKEAKEGRRKKRQKSTSMKTEIEKGLWNERKLKQEEREDQKNGLQFKTKKSAQNIIVKRNFVSRTLETVPKNMKENVKPSKTIFLYI